jgi:hypothetical protein
LTAGDACDGREDEAIAGAGAFTEGEAGIAFKAAKSLAPFLITQNNRRKQSGKDINFYNNTNDDKVNRYMEQRGCSNGDSLRSRRRGG